MRSSVAGQPAAAGPSAPASWSLRVSRTRKTVPMPPLPIGVSTWNGPRTRPCAMPLSSLRAWKRVSLPVRTRWSASALGVVALVARHAAQRRLQLVARQQPAAEDAAQEAPRRSAAWSRASSRCCRARLSAVERVVRPRSSSIGVAAAAQRSAGDGSTSISAVTRPARGSAPSARASAGPRSSCAPCRLPCRSACGRRPGSVRA